MTFEKCPFCSSKNLNRAKPHEKPKEVGCLDCGRSEYHIIMLEVLEEGPPKGTINLNGLPKVDTAIAMKDWREKGWTIT